MPLPAGISSSAEEATFRPAANAPDWVRAVLHGIGAPVTQINADALLLWAKEEGAASNRFNWLNTSLNAPGATDFNSVGVKTYPNFQTGVQATVSTLLEKPTIIAAFKKPHNSLNDIYQGIQSSTYCSEATCAVSNPGYPQTFGVGALPPLGPQGAPGTSPGGFQGSAGPSSTPAVSGCGNRNGGSAYINGPFGIHLLYPCQAKALLGGLAIAGGGFLIVVGLALIVAAGAKGQGPLGRAVPGVAASASAISGMVPERGSARANFAEEAASRPRPRRSETTVRPFTETDATLPSRRERGTRPVNVSS